MNNDSGPVEFIGFVAGIGLAILITATFGAIGGFVVLCGLLVGGFGLLILEGLGDQHGD